MIRTLNLNRKRRMACAVPYPARLLAMMLMYDALDLLALLWRRCWRALVAIVLCLGAAAAIAWICVSCIGCQGQMTPQTAVNAAAIAEQNAIPVLVDFYKSRAKQCVADNENLALRSDCQKRLDYTWDKVWQGDDLFLDSYEAYRAGKVEIGAVAAPYCDLRVLVVDLLPMPDWPLGGCAVVDGGTP